MLPRRGEVWLFDCGMIEKVRPVLILSIPFSDADRAIAEQHRPLGGQHRRLDPFTVERRDHRHGVVVEFGG